MVGISGNKRSVTLLPPGNKLTVWYHIRQRLKKQRFKESLVTSPTNNVHRRRRPPLPTQEEAFAENRVALERGAIVPLVRHRRRRQRKRLEDFTIRAAEYGRLASEFKNSVLNHRRVASEKYTYRWGPQRLQAFDNNSHIMSFLFDATITLRNKVVFRRAYRKIPPAGLLRMFLDWEKITVRVAGQKDRDSMAMFELYDEHHFTFQDNDIASPPVVESKAERESWMKREY